MASTYAADGRPCLEACIRFLVRHLRSLLQDAARATYVSMQSLAGRIVFAGSLMLAAGGAAQAGDLPYEDIRSILFWYILAGLAVLAGLAITARRAGVGDDAQA